MPISTMAPSQSTTNTASPVMDILHQTLEQLQDLPKLTLYSGISALILFVVYLTLRDPRRKHMPPGPRGLPIIGNTLQLPQGDEVSQVIINWAKQYGEVFRIRLGMTDYIYLNTPDAVKELMDKKSNIYSSRHAMPMALDTVSDGNRMLFMGYTKQWRELRKIMHSILTSTQAVNYQPIQMYETRQMCVDLLDKPDQFYHHTRRYTTSVVMQVAYGHRVPNWNDKDVQEIYSVIDNFTSVTAPGAWIVDSFPTLAKYPWLLPFSTWKQKGREMYEHDSKIYIGFWERLVKEIEEGTAQSCVGLDLYYKNKDYKIIPKNMVAYTVAGVLEAGSETTSSSLNTFWMVCLRYPHVMKKIQEEIDRVVGSSRPPVWEDEMKLPYLRATIKELLRWRPVNKFGMNHHLIEDDWYKGYFLPKDSVIMLNWWAIHYDEERYPDPGNFIPERYLNHTLPAADYIAIGDPYKRDHFTYGAGRRACPGVHVAEKSMYMVIARVLWGFNITWPLDKNGQKIEQDIMKMADGFMSTPAEFKAKFTVRDQKRAKIFRGEWAAQQKEGIKFVHLKGAH